MKQLKCIITVIVLLTAANTVYAQRMSVQTNLANVRSGPGTDFVVLWKIEKYHPVEVIKTAEGWCEIKDFEGDKGWVAENLLSAVTTVIVKVAKGNVRSKPDIGSDILFSVVKGVPFKVIEKKGQWFHVEHADGDKGWINEMLIW